MIIGKGTYKGKAKWIKIISSRVYAFVPSMSVQVWECHLPEEAPLPSPLLHPQSQESSWYLGDPTKWLLSEWRPWQSLIPFPKFPVYSEREKGQTKRIAHFSQLKIDFDIEKQIKENRFLSLFSLI